MADDLFDCDVELNVFDHLWKPVEHDGWTWVQTMTAAPETYSLFDASGELMGDVYQRWDRVICWAPFTWAEEAYRSQEDVGKYGFDEVGQRERHFAKIGAALSDWVRRKREDGVDIPLLRDTHAYYYETGNGHNPMTIEEHEYDAGWPPPTENRPAPAIAVDDWQAEQAQDWHCEGYRLRDETGQLRGDVQVRLGVVRAVAARPEDADEMDPSHNPDYYIFDHDRTCRGQIVLQERLRPMALAFEPDERETWLRKAVEAIRATPDPDRAWPPETLGAWGTLGQRLFPTSRRDLPPSPEKPALPPEAED